MQKELGDLKNQFAELKKKVDECAEIIDAKTKENAELDEKLKAVEEKNRILEMKYTISSLSNEIICKNNKLILNKIPNTEIDYINSKKISRNNTRSTANSAINMPVKNSAKTAYEVYKTGLRLPFGGSNYISMNDCK